MFPPPPFDLCPKSRGAAPLDECRDRSTVNFHTPHRRYFMCHHRRPTEANINKHMPSLWKKKKRKKKKKEVGADPTVQRCRAPVPNEVMGLVGWIWTDSRIFQRLSLKASPLTLPIPPPRVCESGPAWLDVWLGDRSVLVLWFFFGMMCIFFFFFIFSSVLSVPWFAFIRLFLEIKFFLSYTTLHTYASWALKFSPVFFPKTELRILDIFCSYLLKALISPGGLSPSSIEVSIPTCWLPEPTDKFVLTI